MEHGLKLWAAYSILFNAMFLDMLRFSVQSFLECRC